ncbi:MAG: RIP metalloprotease RseP [Succinivibrio sp.]|nr:RIP metalloprotease RseP [Succinivibrio sp.]
MLSALWNLCCFALALGILITVHEAGHFYAARWCKVRVLRFSIGFGKVLFRKQGQDGCEYALSVIPLGGYVKMLGEEQSDEASGPDSFLSKSLKQRAFIIAAGPLMNLILAVVLYTGINLSGVTILQPVVGDVLPGSSAQQAGFMRYDLIQKVADSRVQSWQDVMLMIMPQVGSDRPVQVEVAGELGHGEVRRLQLSVQDLELGPRTDALYLIGLRRCYGRVDNQIDSVAPLSPAELAGLKPGDAIVRVGDTDTPDFFRVQDAIQNAPPGPLELIILRDGAKYSAKVVPQLHKDIKQNKSVPFIGIGAKVTGLSELRKEIRYGLVDAVKVSLQETYRMSKLVVVACSKMLTGAISAENISGPIALAKGAGQSASIGISFFISFLAAISVNLGILNLIPIPVLDGGQLLFIAYEAVTGHEPSARARYMLTSLGFSVLITLMVFAVFNDIRGLT